MHWWQWVLQITGAWFYLALVTTGVWCAVMRLYTTPQERKYDLMQRNVNGVT